MRSDSQTAVERLGAPLAAWAAAGGSEPLLVTLLTTSAPRLDGLVLAWRSTAVPVGEGRSVAALVWPDKLAKLALHPDVLAVIPPPELLAGDVDGAAALAAPRRGDGTPDVWFSRQGLGADRAEANGFDGSGVIVGIEDSGVDFAHPDLQGTFARVADPRSPYAGYPLVYDEPSAARYVVSGGNPSGTYYADSRSYFDADVPYGQDSVAQISVPATQLERVEGQQRSTPTTVTRAFRYTNRSRSGRIHYGVHPDTTLNRTEVTGGMTYTLQAVFLVMDTTTAGRYDAVYTDLGDQSSAGPLVASYDFRSIPPARLGPNQDPTIRKDLNGDGLADLSGGLIYFIADGEHHVPILDWLWDADGHLDPTKRIEPPAAGSLVAFFGDYGGSSHGTGVASQIVGQGVIDSRFGVGVNTPPGTGATHGDRVLGGIIRGMAPGARIFATRYLGVPNQWLAMTRGYDGQPNTSDDAQVINNSWGNTSLPQSLQNESDYAATALNAPERSPRTLFVVSTGNGGQGYSTISSPSSGSTVLAVGAANQYGSDDVTSIITQSLQLSLGDRASFSSIGPDLQGRTGVAVLGVGNSASGGVPLNLARNRNGRYDGNSAWVQFGGTSQAGPQVTGVAALVFQAYRRRTGQFPTWAEARALLQGGATDQALDPAVQGAGLADADQSTAAAAGLYGAEVVPSEWTVGDYRGQHYLDFPNVVRRGAAYEQVVTITNRSPLPMAVTLAGVQMLPVGSQDLEIRTRLDQESAYQYKRPDYLVTPDRLRIPAEAELMQVRLAQEFGRFCVEDASGLHLGCGRRGTSAYYLRAYAWHDWNGNGRVWTDANGNGVVNEAELDLPTTPTFASAPDPRTSYELSPIGETNLSGNMQDLRIAHPRQRAGQGLHLALIHRARNEAVPQDVIRLHVTYYRRSAWPWLTLNASSLDVAPGASVPVRATFRVPGDAAYGFYEGSVRIVSQNGTNPRAGLRLFHASPGSPAVDLYVDDRLTASRIAYGSLTGPGYVDVEPGVRRLRVVPAGGDRTAVLADRTWELRSGTEYTALLVAGAAAPALQTTVDGNVTESGRSRIRFGHLSPDAGELDVYLSNQRVLARVRYRDVGRFLNLPNGRYTLRITSAGGTATLLTVGPLSLANESVSVYLIGEARTQTLQAFTIPGVARSHFPRHEFHMPVVANVAAELDFGQAVPFGGAPTADGLFEIGRVLGLTDWRGNGTARQGDWRNLFLDVPEDLPLPPGTRFLAHTSWQDVPSDIDLIAFGPAGRRSAAADTPSGEAIAVGRHFFAVDPTVSGPYDLKIAARTADTGHAADGSGGTAYSFRTATGRAEEWLSGPLAQGLHLFAHHNVLHAGRSASGEVFATELGTASVVPGEVRLWAAAPTGSFAVSVRSSLALPGLEARAYGLQPRQEYHDTVMTATPSGNLNDPNGNRFYELVLADSGYLDIDLAPDGEFAGYDLDLYLQRRRDDGSYVTIANSGGPAADERITVYEAEDGTYRVVVHGYAAPPGSRYRLRIQNAAGHDLTVSAGGLDEPVPPGTTATVRVDYAVDYEDGEQWGMLFIGPKGAPLVFEVPVAIRRGMATVYLPFAVVRF